MATSKTTSAPYLQVLLGSWFALGLLAVLALGVGLVGGLHFWSFSSLQGWTLSHSLAE
jgi:hypothetical protein